jgi:hypothetical protein
VSDRKSSQDITSGESPAPVAPGLHKTECLGIEKAPDLAALLAMLEHLPDEQKAALRAALDRALGQ